MNKNSKINEKFDDLYNKLELALLKERPNPYIALAAVDVLKNNILEFLNRGTSDISPNAWYAD